MPTTRLPPLVKIALGARAVRDHPPFSRRQWACRPLLITFLLTECGVLHKPVLYLSHYFKRIGRPTTSICKRCAMRGAWETWLAFFLRGVIEVGGEAAETARRILQLREQHRRPRMAGGVRRRSARRGGGARRPAQRLFLRPPHARTGGRLGVQARRGAQAAVPGPDLGADPRAELQAGGGRGGVQQGAGDQHSRQPRGAWPAQRPDRRRAGRRARAVPCRLLAGAHLRPRGAAGAGAGLRRRCASRPTAMPAPAEQSAEALQRLEAELRERDEKLAQVLADRRARRRAGSGCAPKWLRRSRPRRPSPTRTTIPKPRPATTSSTCCSRKPAGH
jgi:hypothetical protein